MKSITKKIVLTGGGTAGHVSPNIALIPCLLDMGYEIHYIGTAHGIERKLTKHYQLTYHSISSGKLRRYFAVKNFTDPFRVVIGIMQSYWLMRKIKPNLIFSTGGFVSVPVVIAGWFHKFPSIIHELDISTGLATKLTTPFATKICAAFQEAMAYLPKQKSLYTGTPIRKEILSGTREKGYQITGFNLDKPILLFVGGSQGSKKINDLVRKALPQLRDKYQIIHICGQGKLDNALKDEGYVSYDYVGKNLSHLFAIASIIISRAGTNSIMEILSMKKPNILIPLPASASKGDQILNATAFAAKGFSYVLDEKAITVKKLLAAVESVYTNQNLYIAAMAKIKNNYGMEFILETIADVQK